MQRAISRPVYHCLAGKLKCWTSRDRCDWLLRPLAEREWETQAQAISVGDDACARVTCTDGFTCQLRIVPPGEMPIRAIDLPWPGDANWTPPLVAPDGGTILTPRGHAWSLDPDLQLRWSARRDEDEPMGTLSSNGILLLEQGVRVTALAPYPRTGASACEGRRPIARMGAPGRPAWTAR